MTDGPLLARGVRRDEARGVTERAAEEGVQRCRWCVGGHITGEEIGGKLRRRLELSGIAQADERGRAGELGEPSAIAAAALEERAIEENDDGTFGIERACRRERRDAPDLDVVLTPA